ncbi:MAG: pyridoxal phosphate-dependent aminotransferase [Lentisphaerae bacterium]|nr:pyridoxal phosphate-dependent aminotransferase [Lentisphaerota bacterium]
MNVPLSQRSGEITQSEIRAMTAACKRVGGINMAQGICDLGVPRQVQEGVTRAMADGFNSYGPYAGLPPIREAIAGKMEAYNGIRCDPDRNLILSAGSTGAFYCACLTLLNPGDEVILMEPFYGYHVNMLKAAGAVPRIVTMQPPDWTFSIDELEQAVTSRTRAIVVCTPGNPSGKVFTETEIKAIGALAVKHDFVIITDEIYEYFVYDGRRHVSPGSMPEIADRTVTVSGYSKTFSITGWRIGYCVCPAELTETIGHMNDLVYVCAPTPLQMGVAAGIRELPDSFYADLCDQFHRKRERICNALDEAGLLPYVPQGSYYVLAEASALPGETSRDKALHLLEKTGVASVPGSAFYIDGGESVIRLCYAKPDDELDEACSRLKRL